MAGEYLLVRDSLTERGNAAAARGVGADAGRLEAMMRYCCSWGGGCRDTADTIGGLDELLLLLPAGCWMMERSVLLLAA